MRQAVVGGSLALMIIAAWLALHIYSVFFFQLSRSSWAIAPFLIALLCWLNVGLFIIAHDAMHGSLFPSIPRGNVTFGRVALALYAGFRFDRLKTAHMAHHRLPGTADDPDFDVANPARFWRWYGAFIQRYFGLEEFLILCGPVAIYLGIGVRITNLLLFWALPAILSSLQLFYFGTYRPHRHGDLPFADAHNARTSEFGWLPSLITCFHFGYHHEHHLKPAVPWWRLPAERAARRTARSDRPRG